MENDAQEEPLHTNLELNNQDNNTIPFNYISHSDHFKLLNNISWESRVRDEESFPVSQQKNQLMENNAGQSSKYTGGATPY